MIKELKKAWDAYKKEYRYNHLPKQKGKCKWCGNPIFNMNTNFGRREECPYCYEAFLRGKKEQVEGELEEEGG